MALKCFLVKETKWCILYARRYVSGDIDKCPNHFIHDASVRVGYFPVEKKMYGTTECNSLPDQYKTDKSNSIWPTQCMHCDYIFTDKDEKQDFYEMMYTQVATEDEDVSNILIAANGEVDNSRIWWQRRNLPAGAMYRSSWSKGFFWENETEDPVIVMCPGGTEWNIDSRANNCDKKDDKLHRCWVRTGTLPNITVGKNGNTCGAGGGSIMTPEYHGMLQEGEFRTCGDSKIQV